MQPGPQQGPPSPAGTPRSYLVVAQPQLEPLSLLRIPLGVVLMVGVTGGLAILEIRLLRVVWPDFPNWVLKGLTLAAFGVAFKVTSRVLSRLRSRAKKVRVEASADTVRIWDTDGTEKSFGNSDVRQVDMGRNHLVVERAGVIYRLPLFVERIDGEGVKVEIMGLGAAVGVSFLQLGVHEGKLVVLAVRGGRSRRQSAALPYADPAASASEPR